MYIFVPNINFEKICTHISSSVDVLNDRSQGSFLSYLDFISKVTSISKLHMMLSSHKVDVLKLCSERLSVIQMTYLYFTSIATVCSVLAGTSCQCMLLVVCLCIPCLGTRMSLVVVRKGLSGSSKVSTTVAFRVWSHLHCLVKV